MHCMRTHDESGANCIVARLSCRVDIEICIAIQTSHMTRGERIMQLNHLDLAVPDVAAAATFFEVGFGFKLLRTKGNAGMALLHGDGGFLLVLTRAQQEDEPLYPKTFHIGFLLPTEKAVENAYLRILHAGVSVQHPPRVIRGSLMFYCHTPGGILVEVSHRLEEQPLDRS